VVVTTVVAVTMTVTVAVVAMSVVVVMAVVTVSMAVAVVLSNYDVLHTARAQSQRHVTSVIVRQTQHVDMSRSGCDTYGGAA
jgi:hypothetical protein